eukprot:Skav234249  [mRNA]  locus=scaffold1464:590388:596801:- [translate_table: standard]
MFVTGAHRTTVIHYLPSVTATPSGTGYMPSGPEVKSTPGVVRADSLDGAYLIGAQRPHRRSSSGMLNMLTAEDRKSSTEDGFEDVEGEKPGPNFKIGCRRKLHLT